MQFWLAIGILEQFESGGGSSVRVLEPGMASFSDAVDSLAELDVPGVYGYVTQANAYVVQADSAQEASSVMCTVFMQGEVSPHVKLVQRDIRTEQMPSPPPEMQALSHVFGELAISHQLAELALTRVTSDDQRERLGRHKTALEEFGYAVRVLRGDDVSAGEGQSGRERLGYGAGQVDGAELATLTGALEGLTAELSNAGHQVNRAMERVPPSGVRLLTDLRVELQSFEESVNQMRDEVASHL